MIISFTGHRLDKIGPITLDNPKYKKIYLNTEKVLKELNPEKAISGMAVGYDQIAAVICIRLGIPLVAAIPFVGQENVWPEKAKKTYYNILEKCDEKHIVSEGGYAAYKLQARNEWMVNHSNIIIAAFDGSSGGTANCIKYAEKHNKQIINIYPNEV